MEKHGLKIVGLNCWVETENICLPRIKCEHRLMNKTPFRELIIWYFKTCTQF